MLLHREVTTSCAAALFAPGKARHGRLLGPEAYTRCAASKQLQLDSKCLKLLRCTLPAHTLTRPARIVGIILFFGQDSQFTILAGTILAGQDYKTRNEGQSWPRSSQSWRLDPSVCPGLWPKILASDQDCSLRSFSNVNPRKGSQDDIFLFSPV